MTLRRLWRRLRAFVGGRRIYTATFQPSNAAIYAQLLAIDPRAAVLFAKVSGLPTDEDSQG